MKKTRTAFEILERENSRILRVYLRSLVRDEAAVNEYTLVHGEASWFTAKRLRSFFCPPPGHGWQIAWTYCCQSILKCFSIVAAGGLNIRPTSIQSVNLQNIGPSRIHLVHNTKCYSMFYRLEAGVGSGRGALTN